jgi:hypothetical protein
MKDGKFAGCRILERCPHCGEECEVGQDGI